MTRNVSFSRASCIGWLLATVVACVVLPFPPGAQAALRVIAEEQGRIALSVDGVGTLGSAPTPIEVDKPSDEATVRRALYACASVPGELIRDENVSIAGRTVEWGTEFQNGAYNNVVADITGLIGGNINSRPGGRFALFHQERRPLVVDGCALFVIFDDPTQQADSSAFVLFGGQELDGDSFSISLAEPLRAGESARFGLAISFGFQGGPAASRSCGTAIAQFSIVDVNGTRLSSCAGNLDDAVPGEQSANGNLITVGGIGDTPANPVAPFQTPADGSEPRVLEDELYDLTEFLGPTDTELLVETLNPSNDDNIFAAHFAIAAPAILGEGIIVSPVAAINLVDTTLTVRAQAQGAGGDPLAQTPVTFEVISGPNVGLVEQGTTDEDGVAEFTWSSALSGEDTLVASFVGTGDEVFASNEALTRWVEERIACQVDADDDVDFLDLQQVFLSRGQAAQGNADPRDLDGDGFVSFGDVRGCALLCDQPGCAVSE